VVIARHFATGGRLDSFYRCGIVIDRSGHRAGDRAEDGSGPRSMEVDSIAMKRIVVFVGFVLIAFVSAIAPPEVQTSAQANCFGNGFCMTNPEFVRYFNERGGRNIFGDAISREFTLDGFRVQFFQRVVLQMQGGRVERLNVLDDNVMPMKRVNQSQFPASDPNLQRQAPQNPSSPTYGDEAIRFIQQVSPNTFNGIQVGFFSLFNETVPISVAFPGISPSTGLVTLANMEIWGLPTSAPAADPGNGGFIYQRYQRGIMHYEDTCRCSHGILVGDWFKSVITGQNLPSDLSQDMQNSRYLRQYDSRSPGWVARPAQLPNTDMTGAFEPGTGAVQPGPQPPPAPPAPPAPGTATPTPTPASTTGVEIQVSDALINPGQAIKVTVIARGTVGLTWIEWQGDDTGDSALDETHRFDNCDGNTSCASIWDVTPIKSGRHTLRARARDVNGTRTEWVNTELRVRDGPTVTPTPSTPTPTPGPGTPTATPTAVSSVPDVHVTLSKDTINLGETIQISVIANHNKGLDWIAWQGDNTGDPELDDEIRSDCNNKSPCAFTWTVKPTKRGSFDIRGRAKEEGGARSEWVRTELRVR
jgi:hypothetical protein